MGLAEFGFFTALKVGAPALTTGAQVASAAIVAADEAMHAVVGSVETRLSNALTSNAYDWLIELDRWVKQLMENEITERSKGESRDAVIQEVQERLNSALSNSSGVYWKLLGSYRVEAVRSAERERVEMLAQAAAFAVLHNLDVPRLIRVERALRDLDPADVRLLHRLARFEDIRGRYLDAMQRDVLNELQKSYPIGLALEQTMCVKMTPSKNVVGERAGASITSIGRDVICSTPGFR